MQYVYAPHVVLDISLAPKLAAKNSANSKHQVSCEGCELENRATVLMDICDNCVDELKNKCKDLCDDCYEGLEDPQERTLQNIDDICEECDLQHKDDDGHICDDCIKKYLYICEICKECL